MCGLQTYVADKKTSSRLVATGSGFHGLLFRRGSCPFKSGNSGVGVHFFTNGSSRCGGHYVIAGR